MESPLPIPRWLRVLAGIVSALLAIVGLGGIREDLKGWAGWLAVLDDDAVRTLLVLLAASLYLATDVRFLRWINARHERPILDLHEARTALVERQDAELLAAAHEDAQRRLKEAAEALLANKEAELARLAAEVERLRPFEEAALAAAAAPVTPELEASIPVEENRSQVLAVWVYPGPHGQPDRTLVHAELSGILIRNNGSEPVEITRMWLAVLNPETGRDEWPQADGRYNREELEGEDRIGAHDQQALGLGFERIFGVVIPREEREKYIKLAVASNLGEFRYDLPEALFFPRDKYAALGDDRVSL